MSSTLSGSLLMKCMRLRDARLHAVSSRNIYSEHGLLPLIRPSFGHVCHSLIVVSYCTPGSALAHAARPMRDHSSRAGSVLAGLRSTRLTRSQGLSFCTASMKPLDILTELLEFCPDTVIYASLSQSVS